MTLRQNPYGISDISVYANRGLMCVKINVISYKEVSFYVFWYIQIVLMKKMSRVGMATNNILKFSPYFGLLTTALKFLTEQTSSLQVSGDSFNPNSLGA